MDGRKSKAIENKANELLRVHRKLYPNFNVQELIGELGIRCVLHDFPGNISGASMTEDGVKVVTVNRGHHLNRQRFTQAHELGHILLGHDKALNISEGSIQSEQENDHIVLYRNDNSSLGFDWREVEANHFAACLLMPQEVLEGEIESIGSPFLTEENITLLATKFGVSVSAMTIRLSKLGYL